MPSLVALGFYPVQSPGFGPGTSQALATSADGSVIVGYSTDDGANGYAVLLSAATAGIFAPLPVIAGATSSTGANKAFGISADGTTIVGQNLDATNNLQGFCWTSGGSVGLGYASGCYASTAVGISDDKTKIAMNCVRTADNGTQAAIWVSAAISLLPLVGGAVWSQAFAISGDGTTVVGLLAFGPLSSPTGYHAFRWTLAGGMVDLGVLAGGDFTQAQAVSHDGSIIVGSSNPAGWVTQAWRWTSGTGIVALGGLAGANASNALGISSDGTTVVGSSNDASRTPQAAYYTTGGGWVSIGTGFSPYYLQPEANACSANGLFIVGDTGQEPGEAFSYTITPPVVVANIEVADLFFAPVTQFYDLTNLANQQAFRTAQGGAVFLGASGANALGTQPPFFLSVQGGGAPGGADTFADNQGSAGAMTITSGPLTYSATNPPGSSSGGVNASAAGGPSLVGDYRNGNIYTFNLDEPLDDGVQRKWLRRWRAVARAPTKPQQHASLTIKMETGGQVPDGTSPQLVLRWSDDGGHSWSEQVIEAAGPTGATSQTIRFRRLGATREFTGLDRIYELWSTDQFRVAITGAELE